ncbi:MAG: phenylalanine--tRNA ligase subunit alpha [Candidatus Melainabacteria bacterium HGW-Melainabacteria-1]|nr:MAG: phenylalanine--tRNA ligase subunit alpha [Candidatus Melainabacteria bacterium HGW-Melainabacteria-1]
MTQTSNLSDTVQTTQQEALAAITAAQDDAALEVLRLEYLGKKGRVRAFFQQMGQLAADEKATAGQYVNSARQAIEEAIASRKHALEADRFADLDQKEWLDVTAPGIRQTVTGRGRLHPLTQIQYEVEDIFRSMGFTVFDGPQIEDDFHNFGALNIPADHPARDMQDTFWLSNGRLLRTHTSSVQIRAMHSHKPPLRGISPGRVFRYEATDASHENTFYQVEGLMVDKNISVANLIYVMKVLLREIFQKDVEVRLRPGFFPFVEPGFELDISCLICGGSGCAVCKQEGWVELLPCGAVHPNVLRYCNIDPNEYTGFAFGMGLNRLVMMRYGIDDIRHFQSGNLEFLEQF